MVWLGNEFYRYEQGPRAQREDSYMLRKFMGLFVSLTVVFCFASCKDDESKSAAEYCSDYCNKLLDECSDDYADASGYDDDEIEDALDTCLESCEPDDDYDEYNDCIDGLDWPSECNYSISYDSVYDCFLSSDCGDLAEYATSTGSEDLCEDELGDYNDASEEAEEECTDALEALQEDDEDAYTDLMDAAQECYDDYYPE